MTSFWQNLWYWIEVYDALLWLVMALVVVGALGWLFWQQRQFARLRRHYQTLLSGVEGGNLEAVLDHHLARVQRVVEQMQRVDRLIWELERAGRRHLQHCGLVRFNPFAHTGGDQSFAVALTDAEGYGVVISSLHARDSTRVYAKPLAAWESSYPLTEEEKEAIARARGAG